MLRTLKDGRAFEDSDAVRFEEDAISRNGVLLSMATGDSTSHEALYFVSARFVVNVGQWIIESWTDPLGGSEYEEVSDDRAYEWLITNDCVPDEQFMDLPHLTQKALVLLQARMRQELTTDGGPTTADGIMPALPNTRSEWDD